MNWNLIWPILIVILANTFYNVCMKSMPSDVNPFGALMVTYFVAAIISAVIVSLSNATVIANIGLACVLLIVGYFLYKENVSIRQILGIFVCMIGLILINL